MLEFDDSEIAAEAYRLWQADGSPLWGHPQDHWFRAIESLRARSADAIVLPAGLAAGRPVDEPPGEIDPAA